MTSLSLILVMNTVVYSIKYSCTQYIPDLGRRQDMDNVCENNINTLSAAVNFSPSTSEDSLGCATVLENHNNTTHSVLRIEFIK